MPFSYLYRYNGRMNVFPPSPTPEFSHLSLRRLRNGKWKKNWAPWSVAAHSSPCTSNIFGCYSHLEGEVAVATSLSVVPGKESLYVQNWHFPAPYEGCFHTEIPFASAERSQIVCGESRDSLPISCWSPQHLYHGIWDLISRYAFECWRRFHLQ